MALVPLKDAVERIDWKTPIGSVLRSREWEEVPLALRERAQFSAGVTSAKVLQSIQDRLSKEVKLQKEQLASGDEAMFDRSSFIDAVREIARSEGLTPANEKERGKITDITSIPRLGMIYDMQNQMATGFARWKMDQSAGAMLLYPAWRLVREREAKVPRDWRGRWAEAGESVGWEGASKGDMVALKTSPIWAALSRFGVPWPPFDYNSGMGVEDVDRDEAIALGLLEEGEIPEATGEEDFNERLEASVQDLRPEVRAQLKAAFGDQVVFNGETVRWSGRGNEDHAETPRRQGKKKAAKPAPARTEEDEMLEDLEERMAGAGFTPEIARQAKKIPRKIADLAKTVGVRVGPTATGHYQSWDKTIVMGNDPTKWNGRPELFHHEFGHHVHFELGVVENSGIRTRFKQAVQAAKDRLMGENKDNGGRFSPVASMAFVSELYGVESYLKASPEDKARISRFCDTLGGLTKGTLGWGHAKAYYKKFNNGAMEVFANGYSALVDGDKVFAEHFPEVLEAVKDAMDLPR